MSTKNQSGYRNEVIDWLKTETTGKCICGAKLFVNPQGKIKCRKCPQAVIDCGEHKPASVPSKEYIINNDGTVTFKTVTAETCLVCGAELIPAGIGNQIDGRQYHGLKELASTEWTVCPNCYEQNEETGDWQKKN
jgi:hypothetical protein